MLAKLTQVVLIIIGSAFKYSWLTVFAAESQWGLIPAFIFNFIGGAIGVYIYTYLGEHLRDWYIQRNKAKGTYRVFTKRNKTIIFFRKKLGLKGIAFLSPILITLPLGTAILLTMTKEHQKIIRYLLVSCFFWTAIILIPYKLFHIDLSKLFVDWITQLFASF
jgi:hypothetical protein